MSYSAVMGGSVVPATATPAWFKVASSADFSFFTAAALTNQLALFALPAQGVLHGIRIKHAASFTGGLISAYSLSVGTVASPALYASAFDVFQAPGDTVYQLSSNFAGLSDLGPGQVYVQAVSVGANLSAATAGLVDIWALVSAAKK
jgi:hypothetical protein